MSNIGRKGYFTFILLSIQNSVHFIIIPFITFIILIIILLITVLMGGKYLKIKEEKPKS